MILILHHFIIFDVKPFFFYLIKRCRFESTCIPYPSYKKVNPSSQIIIDGSCTYGCTNTNSIKYTYKIFYSFDLFFTSSISWNNMTDLNDNLILGTQSSELTLLSQLFQNYSNAIFWKIDLTLNNGMSSSNGMATLVLKKNLLPLNGLCYVDSYSGISLSTYFNIKCTSWTDLDGLISKYEYFCMIFFIFYLISKFDNLFSRFICNKCLHY